MNYDAKPRNPHRFLSSPKVTAKFKNADIIRVTVKLDYTTWCCVGAHEISDAIKAADYVLETIETTDWTPTLKKDAKEYAEIHGYTLTNEYATEDLPLKATEQRSYNQGRARGHEEIQKPLLEVLRNNDHPIWESGNLQKALIQLVEEAHIR